MEKFLDFKKNIDYEKLKKSAEVLKQGGLVVFPTETVYGIGTNGLNESAIKKLYEAKHRPLSNPINLLVSNMDMVKKVARDITDIEYKLMESFFPGPFTLILKKSSIVPDILTSNKDTVGIRMPDNKIALELINYANTPIATTSANLAGNPSGTNLKDVMKDFENKADVFIDGGNSKIGIASTIVQVIDGVPNILRQGSITKEQIEKVLKNKAQLGPV